MFNISSGRVAHNNVCDDLLRACTTGEEFQKFVENRLMSDKVSFFDTLQKLKLKRFSTLNKKKMVKVKDQ